MIRAFRYSIAIMLAIIGATLPLSVTAQTAASKIGVVIMHGKGGSPAKYVSDLATALESKGYLVANLEMPWSGKRDYDANVEAAEKQIQDALAVLRNKGAQKLFVAGHSQGGLFALYFGGRYPLDGVIALAPGGSTDSLVIREKLGDSLERARQLVAAGKGEEKSRLEDFESSKGLYPIMITPALYLAWFNPAGAMNQTSAMKAMNPKTPVLYVAPTNDYPGLAKVKRLMFNALPRHPLNKLYEPDASHLGVPAAARDEVVRWITEVTSAG